MEDRSNAADIALLHSRPKELIVRYQETIRIILKTYIRSGMFPPGELDDLVQQVNRELLEKLPKIRSQYNGSALFRTYFSSIVRNICLNLYDTRRRIPVRVPIGEHVPAPETDGPESRILLEDDILAFRAILKQYHNDRPKLLVCLKLACEIPLTRMDILEWWPGCPEEDIDVLLSETDGATRPLSERDRFKLFRPVLNRAERNESSADSIRRWTHLRIQEILHLLNGSPPTSRHTRKTLGILLEDFFNPFLVK